MKDYRIVFVTKIYSVATVNAISKIEAEKIASSIIENGEVNTLSETDIDIDIESVREF